MHVLTFFGENNILWYVLQYGCHVWQYIVVQFSHIMTALSWSIQKYRKNYNGHYGTTLKCLSIGTPKTSNFPFDPNGKLIIFRCPKIWPHYSPVIMCLKFGTLKNC